MFKLTLSKQGDNVAFSLEDESRQVAGNLIPVNVLLQAQLSLLGGQNVVVSLMDIEPQQSGDLFDPKDMPVIN